MVSECKVPILTAQWSYIFSTGFSSSRRTIFNKVLSKTQFWIGSATSCSSELQFIPLCMRYRLWSFICYQLYHSKHYIGLRGHGLVREFDQISNLIIRLLFCATLGIAALEMFNSGAFTTKHNHPQAHHRGSIDLGENGFGMAMEMKSPQI